MSGRRSDEEEQADENIEAQRGHLGGALALIEARGQPARAEEQVEEPAEELAVEVEEALQRLVDHMSPGLVKIEIMLAAVVTIGALELGVTILAMRACCCAGMV